MRQTQDLGTPIGLITEDNSTVTQTFLILETI